MLLSASITNQLTVVCMFRKLIRHFAYMFVCLWHACKHIYCAFAVYMGMCRFKNVKMIDEQHQICFVLFLVLFGALFVSDSFNSLNHKKQEKIYRSKNKAKNKSKTKMPPPTETHSK